MLKGSQSLPYLKVDRQIITRKDLMLNEEYDDIERITAIRTTKLSLSSTPTTIAYDGVVGQKSIGNAAGEIYFQNAGLYTISVKNYIVPTSTLEVWFYVEKKAAGASTWSRITNSGTKLKVYNEGFYTVIGTFPMTIAAGDKIRIQTAISNNGGGSLSNQTATIGGETITQNASVLNIVRI